MTEVDVMLFVVAKTAMVGKSADIGGHGLANLLVDAMMTVQESGRVWSG